MKFIVIAFFCILGMPVAYSSDFRDISWGMSLDQIKEIENAKYIGEKVHPDKKNMYWLDYEVQMEGGTYLLRYTFSNGVLESAGYSIVFPQKGDVCGKSISRFIESVNKKYGEPTFSMVSPDGFDEDLSNCESMIKLKYDRLTNWEAHNKALMLVNINDSGVHFHLIFQPNVSNEILKNI